MVEKGRTKRRLTTLCYYVEPLSGVEGPIHSILALNDRFQRRPISLASLT